MKVLLVYKHTVSIERLAIACLSAALKEKGNEVRLAIVDIMSREAILEMVREYRPAVIGYTAMTGEHDDLAALNREFKAFHEFFAVFGGPHATFFPGFIEEDGIDAVCTGEGDVVFPELCRRLEAGEDYWLTPTFEVKRDGEVFKNEKAHLVDDLDTLPFPDRELLYQADPQFLRNSTKFFMATRGCPYKCSYCFNVNYNKEYKGKGKAVRTRSPEHFIREIEETKNKYLLEHVSMVDDLFILKPRWWLEEFAKLYKERINLPWDCTVRANAVREEDIIMLKESGLRFVWMGVESGDEEAANNILDRAMSNQHLIDAADILRRNGVGLYTLNILGLPVDNPFESDLKTLDLNIRIKPTYGGTSILYPYPGSPIERYVKAQGFLKDDPTSFPETYKRSSMLDFKSEMDRRRIENLHKIFGLIVNFPILRPAAHFLSGLPLAGFYRAVYYLWYGYVYKIKLQPMNWRREGLYFIGLFFRMMKKS
ncbi:B12-binding domain-containing radical SAM protein [Magnetospira sp. QH-2]|uniref:B12-binding domain-containing radical SAM protein n=1 Tax=Magnetospira sp. (strain QH-2) TaxID=1288970 RepID=UPI0003E80F46|nr:radical SAM protein [Magnetospira sp. QH-2]CCQ75493.1 conserved protein of unknown function[Include Cobalamin (vitamin B12)-binding domain and Radical SAM domain] [Magnetospira sp. QH-2]